MTISNLIASWRNAPRLTSFTPFFDQTASGLAGAPDLKQPLADLSLLDFDLHTMVFGDTHQRLWGHFDSHYFASIPYRLEEELRLGAALQSFALNIWARTGRPATIYSLGAGTGCLSRTLAKLGDGRIKTLCCSPTEGNRRSFYDKRGSEDATFFHGPFFELTDKRYASDDSLALFRDGFDVLFEDTTFQMYGPDRENQLAFVAPRIRSGGVLVQVQKLNSHDKQAYVRREQQKDELFKSRFFSETLISKKKEDVVELMTDLQVNMDETIAALGAFFRYAVVTWNSGNFYTIISSNSLEPLTGLLGLMLPPAIPPAYCYEVLPRAIVGQSSLGTVTEAIWRSGAAATAPDHRRPPATSH